MSVRVSNLPQTTAKLKKLGTQLKIVVDGGTYLTANDVRTAAVKSIQTQSSGHAVRRSKQGGGGTYLHFAADKGQAPNTDTGKLVSTITVERIADSHYEIGSGLHYAAILELTGWPWLKPALDGAKGKLMENIVKLADIEIKRLGI